MIVKLTLDADSFTSSDQSTVALGNDLKRLCLLLSELARAPRCRGLQLNLNLASIFSVKAEGIDLRSILKAPDSQGVKHFSHDLKTEIGRLLKFSGERNSVTPDLCAFLSVKAVAGKITSILDYFSLRRQSLIERKASCAVLLNEQPYSFERLCFPIGLVRQFCNMADRILKTHRRRIILGLGLLSDFLPDDYADAGFPTDYKQLKALYAAFATRHRNVIDGCSFQGGDKDRELKCTFSPPSGMPLTLVCGPHLKFYSADFPEIQGAAVSRRDHARIYFTVQPGHELVFIGLITDHVA